MGAMRKIKVGDKVHEVESGTPIEVLAAEYRDKFDDDIILAKYNGKLTELFKRMKADGEIEFITTADKNGRRTYVRSVIFLMQRALIDIDSDNADITVETALGAGSFCRRVGHKEVTEEWLGRLDARMRELADMALPIRKTNMKKSRAMDLFKKQDMSNKQSLMKYRIGSNVNVYEIDGVYDYFYGYMASNTSILKYFKLIKFEDGFVLQFPDKNMKQVAEFNPARKLFNTLMIAQDWGISQGIPTIASLNDAICEGKTREVILTQEAHMERQIGAIAEQIAADRDKKFVMIAGPSSSGKTTFSHRLSAQLRALGINPHPIPLDDYYLDRELIPLDEFGEKDFETIEGLDIELFNSDMSKLLSGEEVLLPSFNFKTGKREYKDHYMKLESDDILVIEGIHGLNDRMSVSLPKESKFKIYISALTMLNLDEHNALSTADGRLIRRIVRDARTRGTSAKDTIAMWDSVRRGEEKHIFPFQEHADVMFNSALIYELPVLKTHVMPQLLAIDEDCTEYMEAKRLIKLLEYVLNMPEQDISSNSLVREFIGGSCFHV